MREIVDLRARVALNIFEYALMFPAGHHALLVFAQFERRAFVGRIPPVAHGSVPFVRGQHPQIIRRANLENVIGNVSEVGFDKETLDLVSTPDGKCLPAS